MAATFSEKTWEGVMLGAADDVLESVDEDDMEAASSKSSASSS